MLLSKAQAAQHLGITPARVGVLIRAGRLPAEKVGSQWVIREEDLALVAKRLPGYPKGRPRRPKE